MREGTTSNPAVQGRLKSRDRQIERQLQLAYLAVMRTPEGRRVMYDVIFTRGHLTSTLLADSVSMAVHEGQRTVAAMLAKELQEKQPDAYVAMITEHLQELMVTRQMADAAKAEAEETE